jgi:hypothetical protein
MIFSIFGAQSIEFAAEDESRAFAAGKSASRRENVIIQTDRAFTEFREVRF